jgi:mRNA-degrading endonuclease toxin of MazEF toxin-antitoxin module
MKCGGLVTVALPGAYGKLRPALVVQSDLFDEHPSVTILPVTGELRATPLFRIDVRSSAANGLGELRPRACRATGSATPSADGGMILVVGQPGYWPCFS